MDPNLQNIEDAANAVEQELEANAATIATDEAQIAADAATHAADQATIAADETTIAKDEDTIAALTPRPVVTITGIQTVLPEKASDGSLGLWYEARSAGAPKTGPHGSINVTVGEPAVDDFHPVALASGSSDNVYLLRRLYPTFSDLQKQILETARFFSIGCKVSLQPLANVQAFELDYQIRKSNGVVIEIGGQLLPDGTLRAFDYVKKVWVALGPKIDLSSMASLDYPVEILIEATCDDKTVTFISVSVNGQKFQVTLSHPVTATTVLNSPYCNAARQYDAKGSAPAYKGVVGEFTISFS